MENLARQENRIIHPDSLLVIVDVQNGFLNDNTRHLLDDIEELMEDHKFTHVVCTKFINQQSSPFVQLMKWTAMQTNEETEVPSEIMQYCETVFPKYGYSCWTAEFTKYVSKVLPKIIYFVGIDTEGCVLISAVDCFSKNVAVEVLADYCDSTGGIDAHKAGVEVMKRLLGEDRVICAEDLDKVTTICDEN